MLIHRPGFGTVFEIAPIGYETSHHTVTTVAADWDFTPIPIPLWLLNRISMCFLDVYFPEVTNTVAADNWISSVSAIQVQPLAGGGWYQAINPGQPEILASSTVNLGHVIGPQDISIPVKGTIGSTLQIKWPSITANANNIIFRSALCVLRVMST
jgi:hypothetical protein